MGHIQTSFYLDMSTPASQLPSALAGSSVGTPTKLGTGDFGSNGNHLSLNANSYNSVYGASATVQPRARQTLMIIKA